MPPFDLEEIWERRRPCAERLAPYVGDVSLLVDQALRDGKRVLFEGAQATLLDLDHGSYPFVTSSNPIARGRRPASASARRGSTACSASSKAYVTRVGEGPFPSEIAGPDQERLRELGGEYGTVTGRERRCGWLDLVALRYAVRVNGMTELVLTKLDVLSEFDEIPVCVAYRLPDGRETRDFPAHQSDFHHAEPRARGAAGLAAADRRRDHRARAAGGRGRDTSSSSSDELGVPVELVGVGRGAERVLA